MKRHNINWLVWLVIVPFLPTAVTAEPESFHQQILALRNKLLAQFDTEQTTGLRLYVQAPKYRSPVQINKEDTAPSQTGGPMAYQLHAACQAELPPPFALMPRDELDLIWSEVELAQVVESADPETSLKGFRQLASQEISHPLDAVIMAQYGEASHYIDGKWRLSPNQIQVTLYLLDVRRIQKYAQTGSIRFSSSHRTEAPIRPPTNNRQQTLQQLQQVVRQQVQQQLPQPRLSSDNLFGLFVTPDRGTGGVYQSGESIRLTVSAAEDCYLAVINLDSVGGLHQLFPNGYESDNFLPAKQVRHIPASGQSDYRLAVSSPFGMEVIKVIASRHPFPADTVVLQAEQLQRQFFPPISDKQSRGLSTMSHWTRAIIVQDQRQDRPSGLAEAMCVFTTTAATSRGRW